MFRSESEITFYRKLAEKIKPQGFRCFLYDDKDFAWLYIITPNNSWLYVDTGDFGGYSITYQYEPSKDFGSGCRYNEYALHEITTQTLLNAENYGKNFGYKGWMNVPNTYDGGRHRENVWRHPNHYKNGYEAMMRSHVSKKLEEL